LNKEKTLVLVLAVSAIALSLSASLTGIISDDGGNPYVFTSLRGENIEIYGGKGVYQYDSVYKAVMFRGFDWVNLVVGFPLLALGMYLYRRGQLKGQLLLAAAFTYFAYNYIIGVMGNAFNILFLVWTALFSVGLFGLILMLTVIDIPSLPGKLEKSFPRKSLSVYMLILGLVLLAQYLAEIIPAYITANPPVSLGIYTTLELAALELGIMIPLHIVGGLMLWKGKAGGYIITTVLAFAACMTFLSLSVAQGLLYVSFQMGSVFDVGFLVFLAMISSGFSFIIFMRVSEVDPQTRPGG